MKTKTITTGIDKQPQSQVVIEQNGVAGDHVLNTKYHGGPDQAVYVYTSEDYDHWEQCLSKRPNYGSFGENMVISGLASTTLRIGDQLIFWDASSKEEVGIEEVGTEKVILEVTAPRIPCANFAAHMNDKSFVKKFVQERKPGFYTRVIKAGQLSMGDTYTLQIGNEKAPTIGELFDLWYKPNPSAEEVGSILQFPLAVRFKISYKEKLN